MIIDVHTHVVPEYFPAYSGNNVATRWPSMGCCDQPHHRSVLIAGKTFREVSHHSWDASQRLLDMQVEKVDRQVLSPMPELLSYWFDVDDAVRMCGHMNHTIANMVNSSPESFYGLGMVPLQDPERAASEMSRLRADYGLLGIEVGTNINGRPIGDPFFEPIFAAAVENGLSIFIHPLHPAGVERVIGPPAMSALVAFPNETAFAAASLVSGGMLTKYPALRIGLSHGGGGFAMMLPRMMQGWETMGRDLFDESPIDIAQRLYYDTLVYDNQTLQYLIDSFGIEQLMVGTDYPFVIREKSPGKRIQSLGLSEHDMSLLQSVNAQRFLACSR
ncbi:MULTISPECIES: amidohydrolase family protein [Cycloclasticus]|uniref:2-amino-3-carboxymuconate-6-semialdehyde decarboxylase n=1 Tax=Cycloclasticus pugetii TaxID=34068 RepID=A0AB33Z0X0_9GAMM|nr:MULTISPECIES: amidohydrolase family protein [Cycloclasticus]ATI02532.1 amidohydrolase [Cycloclasticus sp. PY97N]EPD12995.1 amidohydrolase [Cycloclasticus pugetii]MBV1898633.1 amidohydrolase [Cycloclasticus sp.]SHI64391.1 aminocarboxymuconate-semialdehyde decarboxylase [Cycloclasticus pugetii]